jgi:hypothetical protein
MSASPGITSRNLGDTRGISEYRHLDEMQVEKEEDRPHEQHSKDHTKIKTNPYK